MRNHLAIAAIVAVLVVPDMRGTAVPANRAAGTGAGVLAQFSLSLDYFFPDSIGKPLFSWR